MSENELEQTPTPIPVDEKEKAENQDEGFNEVVDGVVQHFANNQERTAFLAAKNDPSNRR